MPDGSDWNKWSQHVIMELERLNKTLEDTRKELQEVKIAVAMLQVKSGVWGAIGGAFIVALPLIIKEFLK